MSNRQAALKLKLVLTAMILLAVGGVFVFSTANGNGTTPGANEPTITSPTPKSSEIEKRNGKSETPDSETSVSSENASPMVKPDNQAASARPERTLSIGIRKIYAPESQAQQWPLGNKKYTFINAQKFESKYKLWKEFISDITSDSYSELRSDVFIESARYYGTALESGELSGWGEWKIKEITVEKQDAKNEKQEEKNVLRLFLTPSSLKILLTDFEFYDASVEKLPAPNSAPVTQEGEMTVSNDSLPIDANQQTETNSDNLASTQAGAAVMAASFPNGQSVLYIPSEGTIRFRWKAKRLEQNDYQIQAVDSVESLWTIDVPSDQKLSLRSENTDCDSEPLQASISKEKNNSSDSWQYSIRWSGSETAIVHIGSADEKENSFDRFYHQQTTYTFNPYHLNTQCRITFEPDSRSVFPQEIPFNVVHDPRVIWEATFDGQPAEIHVTETGYSVSLKKCKTDNPRPELLIKSDSPLADVYNLPAPKSDKQDESQEKKRDDSEPTISSKLSLPRIKLQSGRWQNGTAVIYTLQSPMSIETVKSSVVDCKRVALRRFQTTVEQESPDADVVMIIEPFKELFYSQTQTIVQWDGSQASFISTIELQAEEGQLYSLTAVLPEGLTIDQASSDQQPDLVEDWDVNANADNPSKRTLTIYLRKSLTPGNSLVLNVRSHAIGDWSKPIELNRLAPIVFDNFEQHTQTLYVNVALNQRFVVGERVLYSPEQGTLSTNQPGDESFKSELPIGIDCFPHSSSAKETETGRLDAYEFCIDLKIWGNCLASLEPVQSDYSVHAKTTIWVEKNSMEEKIELAFSGERSHLSQFQFSYGCDSDSSYAWQGLLVWSDNQYKVKVEPVEGNVFSIEIPRNVSSPFTVYLTRRVDWNQQRSFDVLNSFDCSRLTVNVNVCSRLPRLFDIHAQGMAFVRNVTNGDDDFTIGTYEYEAKTQKPESRIDDNDSSLTPNDSATPRMEISVCKTPQSDVSIWAWSQLVEERHFASGSVLTSAQWTIENRFPSHDSIQAEDDVNRRLKITLPNDSSNAAFNAFLTGVRIDNESVNGENIIQESKNSYIIILPPKKKFFVLTVQWTSFDKPLKTCNSFHPQKPVLDIVVLQSSWNLYYPTSYRRLNSYLSSDQSVDGWLERFFGPLLRRDSFAIMSIVSHIWDADQGTEIKNAGVENRKRDAGIRQSSSGSIKSDSSDVYSATYTLPDNAPWNCCKFNGGGLPKTIQIIRSEVSECIRWTFFIITVSLVLTFYFKRNEKQKETTQKQEEESKDDIPGKLLWGFRRWVCVFGIVCCIMCQALPWFLSLPFSGAFLGTIVTLLVLAVPFSNETANNNSSVLNSVSKTTSVVNSRTRVSMPSPRLFILFSVFLMQTAFGQESVLPPPDSRYIAPEASENREYEIFVPVDQQNQPKSGYYVPQDLLDLMQTRDNLSQNRSWIVCRTQYYGKLVQKPRQTESGLWRCSIEIETLVPDAAVDLPIQLRETVSATSSISVSRGRILKSTNSAVDGDNSDPSGNSNNSEKPKSDSSYWSWDKLDNQTVLQWNPQNERWGIRLAQPGRYLVEVEFRPAIVTIDGKNEISFSILECINSTFELLVPENVTGLEFPGSFGGVTEITPDMEMSDPSIPAQPGLKLKRVQLGAAKKLAVRWNSGGFLSDGPVYDVDTVTWWNVSPDSVDVKIKYNVKVVSGSVSSIKINADERLALLSESSNERWTTQNEDAASDKSKEESQDDSSGSENQEKEKKEKSDMNSAAVDPSLSKSGNAPLPSGVHYSIVPNPEKPNVITVEFDSPITSQASFELHFIWKDALGVGRLHFPTTSAESSRSGQRTLAFTFDSRLQYECASDSLIPMSTQSFLELWRGFQKQNVPVTGNEKVSGNRGNGASISDSASERYGERGSSDKTLPLPPPPQTETNLPTVAYDLNLSRRKTDSSGVVDSVIMNVLRTKASSEGTAEAYVLADCNRLLWQIKWTVNISRGQYSGFNAVLPESFSKPENHLSIITASVNSLDSGSERSTPVSACMEGNELKLYWGTPVEGRCQLIVTGELRPDFDESGKPDSVRQIHFEFPELQTLNVTQYKLALGRTDNSIVKTIFDKPTPKTVVWTQAELSVETPFSSRNQRLLETWQSTVSDTSKKPCAFTVELKNNNVAAEIDAAVKLSQENASALVVNGRVKVAQGILDEFLLDVPENCYAPISSKTTLKCQQDELSITQRRYILRPLSPFSTDSEFELTIPLKKAAGGNWKLEKQSPVLWSVVRSDNQPQTTAIQSNEQQSDSETASNNPDVPASEAHPAIHAFGLKMFVKPVSESEYCASAEFACAVSGTDSVLVRLPKGSKTINVQIDQRSVRWIEKDPDGTLIPIFPENDPVDVRIVYTASFNRTLYTDPMKFEPPTIEQASQPEILWFVSPWKNLTHSDPGTVRTTSFINKQLWLINDLNSQFEFLHQTVGNVSSDAKERFSVKLDAIESQLKQYKHKGEKSRTRTNSGTLIPNPYVFQRPNLTTTETGAIRLAMQNVLRLRMAIASYNRKKETNRNNFWQAIAAEDDFSAAGLDFQSATAKPLVGTSAPGTAFVLSYSLPPTATPSVSIWLALSMLFIPIIIWLAFFPPESFILWRPSFILGCLGIIWLLCFNLYGIAILLFVVAIFDALNKLRQRSKRNIIPLRVR